MTGSADGHLKFWKRKAEGVEFVKHYRSHPGAIVSMAGACAPRRLPHRSAADARRGAQ